MPIFDSSILPYIFTVVFVTGAGCFILPTFLLLVVIIIGITKIFSPPNIFGTPNGGGFINESGVTNGWSAPSWGTGAFTRRADGAFHPPTSAPPMTTSTVDLPLGSTVDSLRVLGGQSGADMKREIDLIDAQIRKNNKTPADIYPANKITLKCGGCGISVGAGQGYMHYNIGVRKTFCISCHASKGLPLRDNDKIENNMSGDTIGEQE